MCDERCRQVRKSKGGTVLKGSRTTRKANVGVKGKKKRGRQISALAPDDQQLTNTGGCGIRGGEVGGV